MDVDDEEPAEYKLLAEGVLESGVSSPATATDQQQYPKNENDFVDMFRKLLTCFAN